MDVMNPVIGNGTDAEAALSTNSHESHFADSAHSLEQVQKLIADLEDLDVVLSIEGGEIAYDAPEGVLTRDLLQLLQTTRSVLRDVLLKRDAVGEDHFDGCSTPPEAFLCRCCGAELPADLEGDFRCERCNQLESQLESWRDFASSQEESADEQDVPGCETCGTCCDVQRLDGVWKCSRCDPEAAERRQRTQRVLKSVQLIRERLRRLKKSTPYTGPTWFRDRLEEDLRRTGRGTDTIGVIDLAPATPCPHCGSVRSYAVRGHDGQSVRRDCSGCGRFIDNPVWYDRSAASEWLVQNAWRPRGHSRSRKSGAGYSRL